MFAKILVVLGLAAAVWTAIGACAEPEATESQQQLFTYRYEAPAAPNLEPLAKSLRESQILEVWTKHVGRWLSPLPIHMEVRFAECGKADSWYDPSQSAIIVCYEELHHSYVTLISLGLQDDALVTAWIGTILGELYHEFAHGLMHVLVLPIAGREEDAADQFSVLALLKHPGGQVLALGSADYLQDMARAEKESGYNLSQRHSLFGQRYFNLLCLTYGSDPSAHAALVEQGRLPEDRAQSCKVEYLRAVHAWESLLEQFFE